jgi:valyl-tRNA synthetase
VRMKPLAEKAIEAVESGAIRFVPENWNATYFNWMRNIRDWCISRQLWWGHRIPAWHCEQCGTIAAGHAPPNKCAHCGSDQFVQDPDVLDTWFSSSLWPFSTLGWPDTTADLQKYYPTTLLITGFDIIFFWVSKMIMMGIACTGEVPFGTVHMHGLVRDAHKQKMSKTKGNTIDPLDITARYGTDAVRMSLLKGVAAGTDIVYTEDRLTTARNFANKLWNAARLIFMNMERSGVEPQVPEPAAAEAMEDRWMFSRLHCSSERLNLYFEQHRYNDVAEELWSLFWDHFCDWYLEVKKLRLSENSGLDDHWRNLLWSFSTLLKMLHPVVPFITEELWHRLDESGKSIALERYPMPAAIDDGTDPERDMQLFQLMVNAWMRAFTAGRKLSRWRSAKRPSWSGWAMCR